MTLRAAGAALALALAAGPARGDGATAKVRVLLEPLRGRGVPAALVQAIEERVCAALAERPGLEVVCPADVAAATLLARNAAIFGECQGDACLERVDALRVADLEVSGALEQGEGGLVLSLRLSRAEGAGPPVVERLPADLDGAAARVPAVVKKLLR